VRPAPILYLNPTAHLGGAEYSLLDLVTHLDSARFAARIACLGDGPLVRAATVQGIPADALPVSRAYLRASLRGQRTGMAGMAVGILQGVPAAWRIRRLARTGSAAIVHSNGNKTHLLGALACLGSGMRLVWHVRDFLPDRAPERRLVALANHRVDAVIANSAAVADHLCAMGIRSNLLHAIPNGIDCSRFSPQGSVAPLRRELGWSNACRVVGMVGMLAPWKGQAVFLEAAREVLRRHPDVRFAVIGDEIYQTAGHGCFREELSRLAGALGLNGAVGFTGYRQDMPEVLRALDVVVHASVEPEPFGRVVAEALACARPVIATEGGGVPEITGRSGDAAVLVPRGSVPDLARAVLALLDDPRRAQRQGEAGRARMLEGFEIGRHVRHVEAVYEALEPRRPLKILHAGKFYPPSRGGMETLLGQLCAGTAAEWEVKALVANHRGRTLRECRDGVKVVRAAALGRFGPVSVCPTLPFHLWKERQDCVILHEPNALAAAILLVWTRARQLVIWHHSDPLRPRWALRPYSWIQRALYPRAACVIVSSPRLADFSVVTRHAKRIAIIPYGIAVDPYREVSAEQRMLAAALRQRYPGPRVLFVGRLVYYKGLEVLLEAMTKCPGTLVIVGQGPLERSLRAQATRLAMDARIQFAGEVPAEDLVAYYHAADIFVLPSTERTEAFGVVQIEAMTCGLPVVSTNLPSGVPWVNQDGVTGLIVPPGDPEALAAAIARLGEDPALRTRMGDAGRRRAVEEFALDRMLRSFKTLVETLASG